jgi:tRNA splicing endonuclease
MNFINLTPHSIKIISSKGVTQNEQTKVLESTPEEIEVILEIPPSGTLARLGQQNLELIETLKVSDEIQIEVKKGTWDKESISGLPEYSGNGEEVYLVSAIVAQAVDRRYDVYSPGGLVRNRNNPSEILGCLYLQC